MVKTGSSTVVVKGKRKRRNQKRQKGKRHSPDDKQRNKKELADRTASQMKQSYSSPNGVANGNQAGAPSAQDGISGKVTDEAQVKVVKESQTQPNTQAASQAEINAQKKKPLINGWIIKNPFTSKDEA